MEEKVKEPASNEPVSSPVERNIPSQKSWSKLVLAGITVTVIVGVIIAVVIYVKSGKSENVQRSTKNHHGKESTTETIIKTVSTEVPINSYNICDTKECSEAAKTLLEYMNKSVKPCDDFYQFVCGKWIKKHPLKGIEVRKLTSEVMYENYKKRLSNLLNKPISGKPHKYIEILKTLYDTCVNNGTNVTIGSMYLQKALRELGGWPVVGGTWNENEFNYVNALIKIYKMGLGQKYLFEFKIGQIFEESVQYLILIDKPQFAMDNEFYDKTKKNKNKVQYIKKIKSVALRLGLDISGKKEDLEEIFQFEFDMFHLQEVGNKTEDFFTLLSVAYVLEIDWKTFVKNLTTNITMHRNQKIKFLSMNYMEELVKLIKRSKKSTIANYLIWRVLQENPPYLEKGSDCVLFIQENLGIAISSMYIKAYFNEDMRKSASVITSYVRNAIIKDLNNLKWMTSEERERVREKIETSDLYFPFVAELLNDTIIDHYYKNLIFDNSSFFMNLVNLRKWQADNNYKLLEKDPYSYSFDWKDHAISTETDENALDVTVINAKYNIFLGFSILQDPAYNENLPMYMNFGGAGNFIGRAIIFAIVESGRLLIKAHSIWKYYIRMEESQSAKCLNDQYKKYISDENKDSDVLKLIRNRIVADQLGFLGAYYAYQLLEKKNGTEAILPGLDYTPKQLFWINLANNYCCNYDKSYNGSLKSWEMPCMFRVKEAFRNIKEFAKDFNCPIVPSRICDMHG